MRVSTAREDMVDAAERLIAERGLGTVSLRDVQSAAGQRNKSAANYHFGTRDGLISAILQTRMRPINERRLAMLADIDSQGCRDDLRGLIEALVVPLAEATIERPGSSYARFLAQVIADPVVVGLVREHLAAESFRAVWQRLAARIDVPSELRDARIERIVGLTVFSLAVWEGGSFHVDVPMAARLPDLIDACVALAEAPLSRGTASALATG